MKTSRSGLLVPTRLYLIELRQESLAAREPVDCVLEAATPGIGPA
jgi:hypothetical protein